jgi:hypothetical protein
MCFSAHGTVAGRWSVKQGMVGTMVMVLAEAIFPGGSTPGRLLLAAVVAYGVLLAMLMVRRALRRRRNRPSEPAAILAAIQDVRPVAVAAQKDQPVALFTFSPQAAAAELPAGVADAPVRPIGPAAGLAVAPAAPAPLPLPAAVVPRKRPRPLRETEDSVLSPETLLARGHELLAAGAPEDAAAQLRLCVRLASKLKQPAIEASARLELGDLALASGDFTMACEHWQLARSLFAGLAQPADVVAIVGRMERTGCPTDWVLTQF